MLFAAFPIHQHSRVLNLIPLRLLAFSNLLTLNVLVNVTIGMGEVIQRSNASARVVSRGSTSIFIKSHYSYIINKISPSAFVKTSGKWQTTA